MVKKKNKKQKKGNAKQRRIDLLLWFSIMVAGVLTLLFFEYALILFIGMLPSWAAWIAVRDSRKSIAVAIGALNFTSCFVYLVDILRADQPMEKSLQLLANPMTLIVIYAAAAAGYMLHFTLTTVTQSFARNKLKMTIRRIDKECEKLIERWGEGVTNLLEKPKTEETEDKKETAS
jgi:hypothetical protein